LRHPSFHTTVHMVPYTAFRPGHAGPIASAYRGTPAECEGGLRSDPRQFGGKRKGGLGAGLSDILGVYPSCSSVTTSSQTMQR
jgi:hypothetical protein